MGGMRTHVGFADRLKLRNLNGPEINKEWVEVGKLKGQSLSNLLRLMECKEGMLTCMQDACEDRMDHDTRKGVGWQGCMVPGRK